MPRLFDFLVENRHVLTTLVCFSFRYITESQLISEYRKRRHIIEHIHTFTTKANWFFRAHNYAYDFFIDKHKESNRNIEVNQKRHQPIPRTMSTKPENVSSHAAGVLGAKGSFKAAETLPPSSLAAVAAAGGGGIQSGGAAANSNKFSMYNINSQFKGKSIEPQQKTNSKTLFAFGDRVRTRSPNQKEKRKKSQAIWAI